MNVDSCVYHALTSCTEDATTKTYSANLPKCQRIITLINTDRFYY